MNTFDQTLLKNSGRINDLRGNAPPSNYISRNGRGLGFTRSLGVNHMTRGPSSTASGRLNPSPNYYIDDNLTRNPYGQVIQSRTLKNNYDGLLLNDNNGGILTPDEDEESRI